MSRGGGGPKEGDVRSGAEAFLPISGEAGAARPVPGEAVLGRDAILRFAVCERGGRERCGRRGGAARVTRSAFQRRRRARAGRAPRPPLTE